MRPTTGAAILVATVAATSAVMSVVGYPDAAPVEAAVRTVADCAEST